MKKNLLVLVAILMASGVIVAAGYKPIMKEIVRKPPVEKTVSFLLYKGSSYGSKAYKGSCAEVYVSVEKVRNTTRTIVWDTTFDAKVLNKYPSAKRAFSQIVTIQNVIESKEHLEMNYLLTYKSKGSVVRMQSPNFNATGVDTLVIKI